MSKVNPCDSEVLQRSCAAWGYRGEPSPGPPSVAAVAAHEEQQGDKETPICTPPTQDQSPHTL